MSEARRSSTKRRHVPVATPAEMTGEWALIDADGNEIEITESPTDVLLDVEVEEEGPESDPTEVKHTFTVRVIRMGSGS